MGGFFQVDLAALQQFITSLRQSGEHMEQALDAMKSMGGNQIGTQDLDSAAGDFQDRWRYGLGQLKNKIGDTNDGVDKAHKAYQETEDGLKNALEQLAQAIPGAQA
jgi:uncharacterized protein YukE